MECKDCNNTVYLKRIATIAGLWLCLAPPVGADVARLWPTAVIIGDEVTLSDICELAISDTSQSATVAATVVAASPPPGGSTFVEAEAVQAALRRAGVNLSTAVITGAIRCAVSRPDHEAPNAPNSTESPSNDDTADLTLRAAVERAFQTRARAHGGDIDLKFPRTPPQTLNLSEPDYAFDVRIHGPRWLGQAVRVDVDLLAGGAKVKSLEFVVTSTLDKLVVVAQRAINQKATIRPGDVALSERNYERVEQIGAGALNAVIGQRARRFIATGDTLRSADLEPVPLVKQGQLVDVFSIAGGIRIKSVGQAASSGGLGDVVELRIGDRRRERLTGTVAGDRKVIISGGGRSVTDHDLELALGVTRGQ